MIERSAIMVVGSFLVPFANRHVCVSYFKIPDQLNLIIKHTAINQHI